MDTQQLVELFNPTNAKNLTQKDLEIMAKLTNEDLEVLAKAYPNKPGQRGYLVLYDTSLPANKQLYSLSTWQNLRNVRKFSNAKNLIPHTFKDLLVTTPKNANLLSRSTESKKMEVDISEKEALNELKSLKGGDKSLKKEPKVKPAPSIKDRVSPSSIANTDDVINLFNDEGDGDDKAKSE